MSKELSTQDLLNKVKERGPIPQNNPNSCNTTNNTTSNIHQYTYNGQNKEKRNDGK